MSNSTENPSNEVIKQKQFDQRLDHLMQDWAKGKTSLREIIGLTPEELYALSQLGYLLYLQGKVQSARVMFEGLVAADPKNGYYYRALGAIYWRLKENQKALRQLTYAIRVTPRDMTSYVNRAEVYVSMRQYDKARNDLQTVLRNARVPQEDALIDKGQAILRMLP